MQHYNHYFVLHYNDRGQTWYTLLVRVQGTLALWRDSLQQGLLIRFPVRNELGEKRCQTESTTHARLDATGTNLFLS